MDIHSRYERRLEEGVEGHWGEDYEHPAGGLQHPNVREGCRAGDGEEGGGGAGGEADPTRRCGSGSVGGREQAGEVGSVSFPLEFFDRRVSDVENCLKNIFEPGVSQIDQFVWFAGVM